MTATEQETLSNKKDPAVEDVEMETAKPLEGPVKESDKKEARNADPSEKKTTEAPLPPPRPIKKARTAYFIFADDKRTEFQASHPGEGVGVIARLTGQAWAVLSPEDRASYQERAAQERASVAQQLAEYKAKYGDVPDPDTPKNSAGAACDLVMPVARIRKICKLDPEVKGMSKEATLLIAKCAELALIKLGKESVKVASLQNRRKLLPEDVAQVCTSREQFLFLREDVKDLIREQVEENKLQKQQSKKQNQAPTNNSKPLTAYFGVSN